ncbi:30S ribosomal protein S18 [Candidatus Gracilibacteria bacterium]|jgi:small subunit ribosomal protein S18|nr:30S ribosomal protein S18 [Candidatus Gracilibacteria bacterium]
MANPAQIQTVTKKACPIKAQGITYIDYKNLKLLRQYTTRYGKIRPRYYSGVCLQMQKRLANAIKRARHMALLPYVK